MLFTAFVIAIVAAIAYVWSSRGFFSALIHMLCVIVAGAIAFALWEPIALLIMSKDDSKDGWMIDWAFGVGLAVPFAVSLAVLRLAMDGIIRKNVDLDGISNWVGGAICGIVSGTITAGMFVLSISNIRLETTIMGWEPITYNDKGSLVVTGKLFFPVDRITGWFYSTMSESTFRVDNSLARWRPSVADEGALLRVNHDDGKSKAFIRPDAFEVLAHYRLDPTDGKDVLNDTFQATKKYAYNYLDGESATPGQVTLEGYIVRFKPQANEKSGRVVVGNGQLRLVVEKTDGTTMGIQPISVISESDVIDPKSKSGPALGRWPFDGQKSFIATFNGRNDAPMAFEFPVPKGAKPIALYVKGQRQRLDTKAVGDLATYTSIAARDQAIANKSITPVSTVKVFETAGAYKSNPAKWPSEPPMRINESMPFNIVMQKDDTGGLQIEEGNRITSGEGKFRNERLGNRGIDAKLQVRKFAVPEDIALIQLTVDGNNREFGFLSEPAGNIDRSAAPVLVDESGQQYACYGYIYKNPAETWITYTPESPVASVSSMPPITRSQPKDQLVLLFRVGKTAKIKYFVVGDKAVAEFDKVWDLGKK